MRAQHQSGAAGTGLAMPELVRVGSAGLAARGALDAAASELIDVEAFVDRLGVRR